MFRIISTTFAMVAAVGGSARACSYGGGIWYLGGDSTASMIVRKNETCVRTVTINNGASSLSSVTASRKPSHGVIGFHGFGNYAYQPARGFSGKDTFTIEIVGEKNGAKGTTHIVVSVDVVD